MTLSDAVREPGEQAQRSPGVLPSEPCQSHISGVEEAGFRGRMSRSREEGGAAMTATASFMRRTTLPPALAAGLAIAGATVGTGPPRHGRWTRM